MPDIFFSSAAFFTCLRRRLLSCGSRQTIHSRPMTENRPWSSPTACKARHDNLDVAKKVGFAVVFSTHF